MKNKITRKRLFRGSLLILLSFLIYNIFFKPEKIEVHITKQKVLVEPLFDEISCTGTINPIEMVNVGTQVSGEISEIYVDFNDKVKKGQIIAVMDTRNLATSVNESQLSMEQSKVQLEIAKRALKRAQDLYDNGVTSKSELEIAQDGYSSALSGFNIAKLQLEKSAVNLGYAKILSPIDGVVISKEIEVGQTVAASFSTPNLFTIANDLAKMKIEASVDEADIGKVKPHQKVTFMVDAFPDESFTGEVAQVQYKSTVVNNVVTYKVIIIMENPEKKLLPGMTATLLIRTKESAAALAVPNSAINYKLNKSDIEVLKEKEYKIIPLKKKEKETIWVLKSKSLIEVPVKVFFSNGIKAHIIGGITEGDIVITRVKISNGNEKGGLFGGDEEDNE